MESMSNNTTVQNMDPTVLIISYGKLAPLEIVENILSEMKQPKILSTNVHNSTDAPNYKCVIHTKYFSNNISLIPFNGKCDNVPAEIIKTTEALIIYFDSKDTSFINRLPEIVNFSQQNQIQVGFLITTSFSGEADELSFKELKEKTNFFFDIITLKGDTEDEVICQKDQKYTEIVDGLRNVVWSNAKLKMNSASSNQAPSSNGEELETQLNDFENLLITAQSLRSNTHLTRDEFLNKAEELAEVISTILNDNDSD